MHKALFMDGGQPVGQSTGNFDSLNNRQAVRGDQVVQRLPFDKLRSQKVKAAGCTTE
jgi:hypothetical protein